MSGDSVADDELLWRRCTSFDMKPDGVAKSSLWRTKELSVHRVKLLTGTRSEALSATAAASGCVAMFEITAGELRALGATVNPDPQENSPEHALVLGMTSSSKAQRARDLARKVWPADAGPGDAAA